MGISKIKTVGFGILAALLIGTTVVVAVKEIHKSQNIGARSTPDIDIGSNEKQQPEIPENEEFASKELEQTNKTPFAKVKQQPKARDFRSESEMALEKNNILAFGKIFKEWHQADPYKAERWMQEWAQKGAEQKYLSEIFTNTIIEWAKINPDTAKAWMEQLDGINVFHGNMTYAVVMGWGAKDLDTAREWALNLPEGQDRVMAVFGVATLWTGKDLEAAADWAMNLPEGQDRHQALRAVALEWAKNDPVAAADWAVNFPRTEKVREATISNVVSLWASKDLDAAKKWCGNSSLSQEMKENVLTLIERIRTTTVPPQIK